MLYCTYENMRMCPALYLLRAPPPLPPIGVLHRMLLTCSIPSWLDIIGTQNSSLETKGGMYVDVGGNMNFYLF